jgi:tyrosyl-tRNA synthetase
MQELLPAMQGFDEQWQILRRGVDQIVPEDEFRKKLDRSIRHGRPLRVKYGIDPTGIDVHLGHTVPLRKLRQFQDLGHKAIIIIGNYTALVGDPSGRDETRAALTREQVEANAHDYLRQVGRIVDLERAEVHRNGDWFSKWSFLQVLDLMRHMTLGQITAREDFAKRMAAAKPVFLHECLYPLMQGWDSVEIQADVELGGTEQLFSLLVARDLQQLRGQEPQVAMTMPILVGTDGVRRMGKSLGNYIGVAESAENQFGKVMSVPDEPMRQYFTLLTDLPLPDVHKLLTSSVNPRDAKEVLGKAIVAQYHGSEAAERAAAEFRRRAAGEDPDEIPDAPLSADKLDAEGRIAAFFLVKELRLETSGSNARRVIEQGGFSIGPNRETITDPKALIYVTDGLIVRVGKRKIARVRLV